jgi:hypothetical protein
MKKKGEIRMETQQTDSKDKQQISIPLDDNRTLGEFIAGLLGQRRSIEREYENYRFEIDHNWLINLHEVIKQRIFSQNEAELISFQIRIYYDDGVIETLNDIMGFYSYHNMYNKLSVGVDLQWAYLVKFPISKVPEKQEIRFVAFIDRKFIKQKLDLKYYKSFFLSDKSDERLFYNVQVTSVIWGEDINTNIDKYIISKIERDSWFRIKIKGFGRSSIMMLTMILSLIVMIWSSIGYEKTVMEKLHTNYGVNLERISTTLTMQKKIDFLVDNTILRANVNYITIMPFIKTIIILFGLSIFLELITVKKRSFINLNEFTSCYLKKYKNNYEFIRYALVLAVVIEILCGIFAHTIYDFLVKII